MQPRAIDKTIDIRADAKQCPDCGRRFSGDAAFCPFDGVTLARAAAAPDPAGADPLVGTTVDGRYEVLSVLGEGGMGRAYRVRHTSLERPFAMKVLRRELARDEDLAARFIQEAKATASVHHPNVVAITDFGELPEGTPYFVMELLVGQTLAQVIKAGGPIPAARAVRIVKQVAAALGAAHDLGIVHRDMKPDNVFLVGGAKEGAPEDVRVVDFGAAKIMGSSRLTRAGVVFGTPHYMSPEQASGAPVDHRADVYALGIILYEMFTGRVPFVADTYMGVLTQHMFVQPAPPSQVCAEAKGLGALEDVTLRCLAKKPEERYASMQDLVAALDGGDPARWARARSDGPGRLADELEPPTLDELRGAVDGAAAALQQRAPWAWIVGAGAVIASAALAWTLVRRAHPPAAARVEAPAPAAAACIRPPTAADAPPPMVASASTPAAPASSAPPVPSTVPPARAAARRSPLPAASGAAAPAATSTRIDEVGDPFASP